MLGDVAARKWVFAEMVRTAARLHSTVVAYWVDTPATFVWVVQPDGRIASARIPVTSARLASNFFTDTPFFDRRPREALRDEDIARAVLYAISQPRHVDVNEMLIRPTAQQA